MKIKLLAIVLLLILPLLGKAQTFEKYGEMREVNSMLITSQMFQLLAGIEIDSDDPEVARYVNLIENLNDIKVLSTYDMSIASDLKKDVSAYISSSALEELLTYKDEEKDVSFYSKPGSKKGYVSQLLMILEAEEDEKPITVVLSITGDIDLKEIAKLAIDLEVPGSEELKKITPP